jgi:hypothetical protein
MVYNFFGFKLRHNDPLATHRGAHRRDPVIPACPPIVQSTLRRSQASVWLIRFIIRYISVIRMEKQKIISQAY